MNTVNSNLNMAYYQHKKHLEQILENKITLNIQEDLLLQILKSGPDLEEVDIEYFYNHSLKRKRSTLKNNITTKLIEGKKFNNEEWASLFENSIDKDNPTLREYFILKLIKSDDELNNFNLISLIN